MNRSISPDDLKQLLYLRKNILVLDVRRKSDYQTDSQKITGAAWLDPDKLTLWSTALPLDRDIIIYCVRGGSVSNLVVDQLQAKGVKARFVEGGFEAWKSSGGEVAAK
ncbi:MAG: rhodanese-like domain-containing protein [Sulfuricaulis sp.]|uniref:rhodanese-like domain-containing protein n=1 Tax=Sulfuricaulis sp. TaxID=2003553 RepID=UPI0025F1FC30|nr:rhodanese-like domain-containing protein [Sulfuricaulis sp.]MCR4345669.1 rhodanese-like domain-containing protein [Sulfuricaulis sp.]